VDKINFDAIPIENDIGQVDMLIDNLPIKIPIINSHNSRKNHRAKN
jgi:hypothetical protein